MNKTLTAFIIVLISASCALAQNEVVLETYVFAPKTENAMLRLVPVPDPGDPCEVGTMFLNSDEDNALYICNLDQTDNLGKYAAFAGNWEFGPGYRISYPMQPYLRKLDVGHGKNNLGVGTLEGDTQFLLEGNDASILSVGTFGDGTLLYNYTNYPYDEDVVPDNTSKTGLIWYPRRSSFRAGTFSNDNEEFWLDHPQPNKRNNDDVSFAFGKDVLVRGKYNTVAGGSNHAIQTGPSVKGQLALSNLEYNFIGGGKGHTIQVRNGASYNTIFGGRNSFIHRNHSFIGGGGGDAIDCSGASINDPTLCNRNSIDAKNSFIGGGWANRIESGDGDHAERSIAGGYFNRLINHIGNSIIGGDLNLADYAANAFLGGGSSNVISSRSTTIAGGKDNVAGDGAVDTGSESVVIGGQQNHAEASGSVVSGGLENKNFGSMSTISGGFLNKIGYDGAPYGGRSDSTIGGGYNNVIHSKSSFIGGGGDAPLAIVNYIEGNNTVSRDTSSVLGGAGNHNAGIHSYIAGGLNNQILAGNKNTIAGGNLNVIHGGDNHWVYGKNMRVSATHGTFVFGYSDDPVSNTDIVTEKSSFVIPNHCVTNPATPTAPCEEIKVKVGIGELNPQHMVDIAPEGTNKGNFLIDNTGNLYLANLAALPANPSNKQLMYCNSTSCSSAVKNEVGKGLDLAELFTVAENVEAGDLLVISKNNSEIVLKKSEVAYDKKSIGIVSTSPAIVFEGDRIIVGPDKDYQAEDSKAPVALAGRVPLKVSLENGPIEVGDLLASSTMNGHAMKATDLDKSFDSIVAKALEPFDGGENKDLSGKIMVLMMVK